MVDLCFTGEVGAGVLNHTCSTPSATPLSACTRTNYTFVVIEHDMDFIGRLCDPVICMWPKKAANVIKARLMKSKRTNR
jgi:ABC-type branched-subunit amino acid transport system ATPase component